MVGGLKLEAFKDPFQPKTFNEFLFFFFFAFLTARKTDVWYKIQVKKTRASNSVTWVCSCIVRKNN